MAFGSSNIKKPEAITTPASLATTWRKVVHQTLSSAGFLQQSSWKLNGELGAYACYEPRIILRRLLQSNVFHEQGLGIALTLAAYWEPEARRALRLCCLRQAGRFRFLAAGLWYINRGRILLHCIIYGLIRGALAATFPPREWSCDLGHAARQLRLS